MRGGRKEGGLLDARSFGLTFDLPVCKVCLRFTLDILDAMLAAPAHPRQREAVQLD